MLHPNSSPAARQSGGCHDAGLVLIAPKTVPHTSTIVDSGVASVVTNDESNPVEVGRISPGETIGEAGILAGLPARVKITTLTHSVVYQLKAQDLAVVLKKSPDVAKLMCELMSRRQQTLDTVAVPAHIAQSGKPFFEWLLDGVRKLHDIKF
jgi:CRP-like cAMP-binding protein